MYIYIVILCSLVVSDGIAVITTIKIDGCNDSRILSTRTTTVSNKNIISLYYTQVYRIITTRDSNPMPGRRCCCPAKRKTSRFRAARARLSIIAVIDSPARPSLTLRRMYRAAYDWPC